jgi:transcriptional regulator with XRE-family HTH domain
MTKTQRNPAAAPDPRSPQAQADGALVTKALLRAAARLDLANKDLARILGLSEATVSRMTRGAHVLSPEQKPFEIALLFVRLYRSLDSIAGGDANVARAWLRAPNSALGATPLGSVMSIAGLMETIAYLDARRAAV